MLCIAISLAGVSCGNGGKSPDGGLDDYGGPMVNEDSTSAHDVQSDSESEPEAESPPVGEGDPAPVQQTYSDDAFSFVDDEGWQYMFQPDWSAVDISSLVTFSKSTRFSPPGKAAIVTDFPYSARVSPPNQDVGTLLSATPDRLAPDQAYDWGVFFSVDRSVFTELDEDGSLDFGSLEDQMQCGAALWVEDEPAIMARLGGSAFGVGCRVGMGPSVGSSSPTSAEALEPTIDKLLDQLSRSPNPIPYVTFHNDCTIYFFDDGTIESSVECGDRTKPF